VAFYDIVLIALGLAGLVWLIVGVLRYGLALGAPRVLVVGATAAGFGGLVNLILGGAHLLAVLARPIQGRPVAGAEVFEYTFHYYSLVLLGFAVVVPALYLVGRVRGVARGELGAWRIAFWMTVILLAVNAPLIPIQGFAPLLSGTALAGLLGLTAARSRLRSAEKSSSAAAAR
jgi:hypothetical protein